MASQLSTSSEASASPTEIPSTPQPFGLDLPTKRELARSISPSTSMMVAGSSSALHSSSITPPPSSQAPQRRTLQSPTPDPLVLSSPPPTLANGANGSRTETMSALSRPTQDQVANSSAAELREMLNRVVGENAKLEAAVGEARMSAAHYKLQHNLLTIESEEALKRMEVEHQMTRREVQVLQDSSRDSSALDYINKLKLYCKTLEEEAQLSDRRLDRAKRVIDGKDDELNSAYEKISMLEDRLRQNREHINELRSPGGPLHISTPKSGPATPQYRATPRYTPTSHRSIRYTPQQNPESQERFSALIAAATSQENNSAPSTPLTARQYIARSSNKHSRGVQSLSSLPTTPGSARPPTASSTLLASAQFSPQAEARLANNLGIVKHHRERRRKSRDSTISASDSDEIARAVADARREDSEEIQESQASQSATSMLRADPRESFEVAVSRTTTPLPLEKNVLQSKLFPSVTKRKLDPDHGHGPSKKMRTGGIGLGIDYESARV